MLKKIIMEELSSILNEREDPLQRLKDQQEENRNILKHYNPQKLDLLQFSEESYSTLKNAAYALAKQLKNTNTQIQVYIDETEGSSEENISERKLTKPQEKKKEKFVMGMKSAKKDFEKRYPGRGEEVMYATATKMAKNKKNKKED